MASKAIRIGEHHSSCPHLGTTHGLNSHFVYPSQRAACYAQTKPVSILLGHQKTYCFTDKYVNCPVYTLPKKDPAPKRRRLVLPILLVAGFAWVLLAVFAIFTMRGTDDEREAGFVDATRAEPASITITSVASTQPDSTASPDPLLAGSAKKTAEPTVSPTQPATETTTPTGTSEPTASSSPTLTPTATNSPTVTSTSTPTATPTSTSSPTTIFVPASPTTRGLIPTSRPLLPAPPSPNPDQPTATKISLTP
jgi:cytoskeletal protein RodZ